MTDHGILTPRDAADQVEGGKQMIILWNLEYLTSGGVHSTQCTTSYSLQLRYLLCTVGSCTYLGILGRWVGRQAGRYRPYTAYNW